MKLMHPGNRRRHSTPEEFEAALDALEYNPKKISAADWPGNFESLNEAGLYSWWVNEAGARDLSEGIGRPVTTSRIYVGQTGATRQKSGTLSEATLSKRIGSNHLGGKKGGGRVRTSTLRRTLAASLLRVLNFKAIGPKKMDMNSERELSNWMRTHLAVAVFPFKDRNVLKHLEEMVLGELDPPLNIEGMKLNPLRARVQELRKIITGTIPSGKDERADSEEGVERRSLTTPSVDRVNDIKLKSSVTLHEEIVDILLEHEEE